MEQALRLVPTLESLAPLRALLVSASRFDERRMWSSSAPYMTVGKRDVEPSDLRSRLDPLLHRIARHTAEQYEAAVAVLDRCQQGDPAGAVVELLAAGRREERVGRLAAAASWYSVALGLAEGLTGRRPEVAALLALGAIDRQGGAFAAAAREYQRCLVLSESESDDEGALTAALALGEIALTSGNFAGARAWYTRGLRQAQAGEHGARIGRVHGHFAVLALREGDLRGALANLPRALACFRPDGDAADLARVLRIQGIVHEVLNERAAAAGDYREALMWALRDAEAPELELSIRLSLAKFHLRGDRLLDAEEEMRRAEERALAKGVSSWLVRVYILMGEARGRVGDEDGFVFFEQAIELCRSLEYTALLEAEAYRAYGSFHEALGDRETAGACFDRAKRILEPLGGAVDPTVLGASAVW